MHFSFTGYSQQSRMPTMMGYPECGLVRHRYEDVTWVPSGSPGKFMYLVTLPEGKRAMAKLTQAYGRPAHEALAAAGLAPKLFADHCRQGLKVLCTVCIGRHLHPSSIWNAKPLPYSGLLAESKPGHCDHLVR